jgi:hypothetical protein
MHSPNRLDSHQKSLPMRTSAFSDRLSEIERAEICFNLTYRVPIVLSCRIVFLTGAIPSP